MTPEQILQRFEKKRAETTTQEILDAAYEALNGLSMGWQMANVKDDEVRTRMQAPINAGTDALVALIRKLEGVS